MMRLSPAMTWSRRGTDIYVHGESQVLQLRDCPPEADSLLRLLERGCEEATFGTLDLETARVAEILDALRQAKCLVPTASTRWIGTPYERQADYFSALGADPDDVQSRLRSVSIAILGVGGIGSVALTHLVAAGVGRYTLIDGDTVQAGNLNRQVIYHPADLGRLKVEVAAEWVHQRNPAATVRSVPRMMGESSELVPALADRTSLLVLAADTPSDIGMVAAQACLDTDTALMSADCGLRMASWGPLLQPDDLHAHVAALRARKDRAAIPSAAAPMAASFGPTNAIVASYMARDILHWFAGLPVPSLRAKVTIDMDAATVTTMVSPSSVDL